MNLFKKKKTEGKEYGTPGGWWRGNMKSEWWTKLVEYYKKDIDPNVDPEIDAQKIYNHWLSHYLSK